MKLPTFQFPHISRRIPEQFILWLSLLLLLYVNIYAKNTIASDIVNTLPVLLKPNSAQAHINFAQSLWNKGQTTEAKQEARIAHELNTHTGVLGASTDVSTLLANWESAPIKLQSGLDMWKNIIRTHPDYADAFVMAAVYAYQLGNTHEAKNFINQAVTLNPVSPIIRQFSSIIQ